jgi:hypothetical protein
LTTPRTVLALAVLSAATAALAEGPVMKKAKRLAPPDPAPALAAPEEAKVAVLGSCALAAGACADYEGAFAGQDAKALCSAAKGTWSGSPCSAENRVGSCQQRQGGSGDRIVTYSYEPTTVDAAKAACSNTAMGIFLKLKQEPKPEQAAAEKR